MICFGALSLLFCPDLVILSKDKAWGPEVGNRITIAAFYSSCVDVMLMYKLDFLRHRGEICMLVSQQDRKAKVVCVLS